MKGIIPFHYFLGANTIEGFVSYYQGLVDLKAARRLYILKGGPGTGKSTFMKKVADALMKEGLETHCVHCSGDPGSLDAVCFPEIACAVVDGTSPHVIDPQYPGAVDSIIDLGGYRDDNVLRSRKEEIIELTDKISLSFRSAYQYLGAAGYISRDSYAAAAGAVDFGKIGQFSHRFFERRGLEGGDGGRIYKRFIGSLTHAGLISFHSELSARALETVLVEDCCGIGFVLLSTLRDIAVSKGLDTEVYYSFLSPRDGPEALYFPKYSLAVLLSSELFSPEKNELRAIRCKRFLDFDIFSRQKLRLKFNKKTLTLLLEEAVNELDIAKRLHDKLEEIYKSAMDFDKVSAAADSVIEAFLGEKKEPSL